MLRVIQQERHYETAFGAFLQGAGGKKANTFGEFLTSLGVDRTRPDGDTEAALRAREVERVKAKLGRLYRAPITA
jgi:hypothetical protein